MSLLLFSFIPHALADPLQLLSQRNPSVPQPAGGNGNSIAPWLSADGRFVVFSSSANNLVTNDNGYLGLDVFVRDRASNTTILVSANISGTGGGNGNSMYGIVSTNGRYAVFESEASDLVAGDTNGASDIFMRDLLTATTTLVSVATNGGAANRSSSGPVMTPDGRYAAFVSDASNLAINDSNGFTDIFVRDLVNQTTRLVSVGATTNTGVFMSMPAISADGRYVAFSSNARGLAPGIPANPVGEVYIRDLVASSTIWASTNALASVTNVLNLFPGASFVMLPSEHPSLSDDGTHVAFRSGGSSSGRATALILGFDSATRLTTIVNTNAVVALAQNDDVYGPEMTPDGRFIAYVARQANTNFSLVNLWDAQTGTNILVSTDASGNVPTNTLSHTPVISPDGRFVAFLSNATNLIGNAVSNGFHIYLRDLQLGTTLLMDADTNAVGSADNWGTVPSLSADGKFIAFCSLGGNLVGSDDNKAYDVFLRDTAAATTELVSQRSPAVETQAGNSLSLIGPLSVSADGRWVTFASYASDLVTNDYNNERDVFVRDLLTGSNLLVSVGTNGNAASGGNSITPVISADGRYVAFVSLATNLVSNDANRAADIFLRDLQAGSTARVSVKSNSVSIGTGDASAPAISADGRYVAFLCYTNTTATTPWTFWRDSVAGTTIALNTGSSNGPSISADGQRVAYFNNLSALVVRDMQLATNIYTVPAVSSAAISPAGNRVAYHRALTKELFVWDFTARSNLFQVSTAVAIRSAAQWSSDGRFLAFVTAANLVPGDSNNTNDVYLRDLQTSTLTLVSANSSGTGSAGGASDSPAMSGDGRFVAFRSIATNVVAGITSSPSLFILDRLTGSISLLATVTPGSGWSSRVFPPLVNSNGTTVVFYSWASGLTAGDLNRVADVFSQSVDLVPATDSDGDGIPDWWLVGYFGHATGEAGDKSRAQDDADDDGMTNLEEYLAGTVPTDINSVFKIQITVTAVPGNNVLLTWPAVTGKSYRIQYKSDLSDPVWLDANGSPTVIGNEGSYTAPGNSSGRYYQIILVE